jgi:hypothetical protein
MQRKLMAIALLTIGCPLFFVTEASAQYGVGINITGGDFLRSRFQATGEVLSAPRAPRSRGVGGRDITTVDNRNSKPFANYTPAPTVSPYVNLGRNDSDLGLPTYQTLVQPFVQQREFNQRQQHDMQRVNQQFQSVRSQLEVQQTQTQLRPTGHGVYFNNLSHYYPGR